MEVHDDSRPDRRRYRRLGGITAAVEWAAREAELRGLPLRIVSAAALPPRMAEHETASGVATVADTVVNDRDRGLAAATERAAAVAPDVLVDADGLGGSPAQAITEAGSGASMLVVGSRGMGAFTALILGSVSRYAAAHAPARSSSSASRRPPPARRSGSASAIRPMRRLRSSSRSRRPRCARPAWSRCTPGTRAATSAGPPGRWRRRARTPSRNA